MQCANAIRFEAQVSHPHHRYNSEWRELTKPASAKSRRNLFLRHANVTNLLQRIRSEFPTLQGHLDPHRVEMWERLPAAPTERNPFWIVILVIILASIASHAPWRDIVGPEVANTLTFVNRDMTSGNDLLAFGPRIAVSRALAESDYASINLPAIEKGSPELFAALRTAAISARDRRATATGFRAEAVGIMNDHVDAVLRNMPNALLADYARVVLKQARNARKASWDRCIKHLFRPDPQGGLSAADYADLDRVHARMLAVPRPVPRPRSQATTFKLDPGVSRAIRQRSGMAQGKRFSSALMNEGTAQDRCTVRIAAIDVALDQPAKRRDDLLRALVGQ